jgi:hypothetical protein
MREVAECPSSFTPLGRKDERIETERYTVCMREGMRHNTVQRQRFTTTRSTTCWRRSERYCARAVVRWETCRLNREPSKASSSGRIGAGPGASDLRRRRLGRLVHSVLGNYD